MIGLDKVEAGFMISKVYSNQSEFTMDEAEEWEERHDNPEAEVFYVETEIDSKDFSIEINGLSPETTYNVCAYVCLGEYDDEDYYVYGCMQEFKTDKAAFVDNCTVKPQTLVTLADGAAWEYTWDNSVAYFYENFGTAEVVNGMSDDEMIAYLTSETYRYTPDIIVGTFSSLSNLTPETEYIFVSIAYDANGNRGELVKIPFRTKSDRNQAKATVSNLHYISSEESWAWDITMNSQTLKYYDCVFTNPSLSDIGYAFYIATKSIPYYEPKNESGEYWYYTSNSDKCTIVTWAIDQSGELSGVISYGSSIGGQSQYKAPARSKSGKPRLTHHKYDPNAIKAVGR